MEKEEFNFKQLFNEFLEIEKRYNLFEKKEQNVYYWKILRYHVFHEINKQKQGIRAIHLKATRKDKVKNLLSMIKNAIFMNPFLKRRKEIIVLDHPRKLKFQDIEIDPYTHFFLKDMDKSEYELLERRYVGKFKKSVNSTNSSTDFFSLLNFINKKLRKITLSDHTIRLLAELEDEIQNKFDVKIDLQKLAYEKISNFISVRQIFGFYLRKKRPKKLYLVVSYELDPFVAAAQDQNIEVIEFQHGLMGPNHIGYHFPDIEFVPYFPDQLYLFGRYWEEITALPKNTRVKYYGYPYLKFYIDHYKIDINAKNDREIVVISQGTIGKSLSKIIHDLAQRLPDYNFKYKLHPGEFGRWKNDYPWLKKLSQFPNVKVIENEENLYDMFSKAKYVIGVNSTAIFEAMAFKVVPVIVKLPSYEVMKTLERKYGVPIMETSEQIANWITISQKQSHVQNIDINSIFFGLYNDSIGNK